MVVEVVYEVLEYVGRQVSVLFLILSLVVVVSELFLFNCTFVSLGLFL